MDEKQFMDQISFTPQFEGGFSREKVARFENVIIGGMGGSALPARILFFLDSTYPAWLHDDYGLPAKSEGETLYVAISYSGNTAETFSFAKEALEKKYSLVIITGGGALLKLARKNNLPRVIIPSGFQPRAVVIYMLRALLYVIGREDLFSGSKEDFIDFQKAFEHGRAIGKKLEKKIPLIYASRSNQTLSYIWKIMLNETGKIPAFVNYFPELAHNEAQGIIPETAGKLSENLKVLLLLDKEDDERVRHGIKVFQELASSKDVDVSAVELPSGKVNKLLYTLATAEGAAQVVAALHGVRPDEVPFIELFKKSL